MNLKEKISENQKAALKSGDTLRLSTLRMLASAIANKEIELRKKDVGLSDQEVFEVISSEAKRRRDAAGEYRKGGRGDLAEKEEAELKILREYLPPEISDEELLRVVKDGMREAGLPAGKAGDKNFGKVMKVVMPILKGKAAGDRIARVLQGELDKIA